MILKIQKFGNSKGLILPKKLISMCSIREQVSVVVEDNHIIITPADQPRNGWAEQFEAALNVDNQPENDFSEGFGNDFDKNEWVW